MEKVAQKKPIYNIGDEVYFLSCKDGYCRKGKGIIKSITSSDYNGSPTMFWYTIKNLFYEDFEVYETRVCYTEEELKNIAYEIFIEGCKILNNKVLEKRVWEGDYIKETLGKISSLHHLFGFTFQIDPYENKKIIKDLNKANKKIKELKKKLKEK